jgi:hypothetical protein
MEEEKWGSGMRRREMKKKRRLTRRVGLTYHVNINKVHDVYGRNLLTSLEWMGVFSECTVKSVSPRHNGLCIPEIMASLRNRIVMRKVVKDPKCARGGISRDGKLGDHANKQRSTLLSFAICGFAICEFYVRVLGGGGRMDAASFFLRNYRVGGSQEPAEIRRACSRLIP